MLGGGDYWLVSVVEGVVDVGLLLNGGIVEAIVDPQGYEINVLALHGSGLYGGVLRFEVARKLGAVMSFVW